MEGRPLRISFFVYTDHKTLLNFHTQKDMSHRQARWMEELSIYDCKFVYIKGSDNTVADTLSRFPYSSITSPSEAESTASHPYNNSSQAQYNILHHPCPQNTPLSMIAALVDTNIPSVACSTLAIDNQFLLVI